jgi:hypothetical protein
MRAQRVNKTELAKRLQVHLPQVDRLLNIRHGSKLDQLEAAAKALGLRLTISLTAAAAQPAERHIGRTARVPLSVVARKRLAAARHKHRGVRAGVIQAEAPRRPGIAGKKR